MARQAEIRRAEKATRKSNAVTVANVSGSAGRKSFSTAQGSRGRKVTHVLSPGKSNVPSILRAPITSKGFPLSRSKGFCIPGAARLIQTVSLVQRLNTQAAR